MLLIVTISLYAVNGLLAVPVTVLFVEVMAAFQAVVRKEFEEVKVDSLGSVAVIVPAHNESVGVLPTIADIRPQLRAEDLLVVVADNCTDDTAALAAAAGATVLVRDNPNEV